MFTGRWFHELSVGWLTPLDDAPDAGGVSGQRGYATAGFIANTSYCGTDSGLARGFTRYQDYIFPEAHRTQDGRARQSSPGRLSGDGLFRGGLARGRVCCPHVERSGSRWKTIARERRRSIASSLTGWLVPPQSRAAVLCFLELLRCSFSLSIDAWEASSFRGRADRRLSARPDPTLVGHRQDDSLTRRRGVCRRRL